MKIRHIETGRIMEVMPGTIYPKKIYEEIKDEVKTEEEAPKKKPATTPKAKAAKTVKK